MIKKLIKKLFTFHFSLFTRAERESGFTMLEMLIVIGIIALLSSVALVSLSSSRERTRDAQRLSDMDQIRKALLLFKEENPAGRYPFSWIPPLGEPGGSDNDCSSNTVSSGGWDAGYLGSEENFINQLEPKYFKKVPGDPLSSTSCGERGSVNLYYYYRFAAGIANGCPIERGGYYILGIKNLETFSGPASSNIEGRYASPNAQEVLNVCNTTFKSNMLNSFEWVDGKFEK